MELEKNDKIVLDIKMPIIPTITVARHFNQPPEARITTSDVSLNFGIQGSYDTGVDEGQDSQGILVVGDQILSVTKLLSCSEDISVPLGAIIVQSQDDHATMLPSATPSFLDSEITCPELNTITTTGRNDLNTSTTTIGALSAGENSCASDSINKITVERSSSSVTLALVDNSKLSPNVSSGTNTQQELQTLSSRHVIINKCDKNGADVTTDIASDESAASLTIPLDSKKTFKCDLCSASFNRQGNYNRHRMIHTVRLKDDYRYKCDVCGKQFLQRCDMIRHKTIHDGNEPHRCDICRKGYIRASDLRVHMKFHFKQKNFKCDHCDKAFVQSGDLNRHVRSVHLKTKMLGCGHCLKKFAKEVTLLRHMQTAHWEIIMKSVEKDKREVSCRGPMTKTPPVQAIGQYTLKT